MGPERSMLRVAQLLALSACVGLVACKPTRDDGALPVAEPNVAASQTEAPAPTEPSRGAEEQASEGVTVEPLGSPGRTDGCPSGMVRVEGEYCPAVVQECLEEHPEYLKH